MTKIKNNLVEILILISTLLLLFYSSDVIMYSDSARYLNGSSNNTPLYATLVLIIQSIFETYNSIVVFQTLFLGLGIIFFTNTLAIYFHLDILKKLIVSIFLFLPVLKFYNNLLTEPICYALSLFFVSFIVKLIFKFDIRNLIWSAIFVILLLLSRTQFLFLYPLILLIYLGIFIINTSKKNFILLTICFMSIFVIQSSLITLNKNFHKGNYQSKNLLDSQRGIFHFIFIDAMYISSSKDIELFENKELKKTFTEIFTKMDDRNASIKNYDGRGHFGLSFGIIRDIANKENFISIPDKKEISIKIISMNFGKYVKLIFKKFYDSTWLFILVPFFMFLAASIEFYKHKSKVSLVIIFSSSFALANHSVIYLFGRVQPRYLIYSDFILLIFIFMIFSIFLQKKDL
tara:strand:- start:342 stop:1550 length:1209 start_codon:yes stop_codon:yes gene_type:complete